MGRKSNPPKIIIPKKKAGSKSLSGRIRKQQETVLDNVAASVVTTLRRFMSSELPAVYTLIQAADALGVSLRTFKALVATGIIPAGEKSPCGDQYYLPSHIKCLTLARARFIYLTDGGTIKVNQEPLKQFIARYWPQEVYDERKGKWRTRQADHGDSDGFLTDY